MSNNINTTASSDSSGATSPHAGSSRRAPSSTTSSSRYESQKRRDWATFGQYLRNHRPPLELARCSGAHVLEFLRYLDQFGKTKVHVMGCPFFGHPQPPAPCPCPLRQAWGSLDALVGRLRAAFEENGGLPEANPFGARAVRLYLREVRDTQAKARGIAYEKKRRKKPPQSQQPKQQQSVAAVSTPPPQAPQLPQLAPPDYQLSTGPPNYLQMVTTGLNLEDGRYQLYHPHPLALHHGQVLVASSSDAGDGAGGSASGVVVAVAPDSFPGAFMPLSVKY